MEGSQKRDKFKMNNHHPIELLQWKSKWKIIFEKRNILIHLNFFLQRSINKNLEAAPQRRIKVKWKVLCPKIISHFNRKMDWLIQLKLRILHLNKWLEKLNIIVKYWVTYRLTSMDYVTNLKKYKTNLNQCNQSSNHRLLLQTKIITQWVLKKVIMSSIFKLEDHLKIYKHLKIKVTWIQFKLSK